MTDSETTSPQPTVVELTLDTTAKINYRAWFYSFVLLLGAIVLGTQQPEFQVWPVLHLSLLFAYMSLACTFCPWPTAWLIMAASGTYAIPPLLVATVATVGTCVANLHDYYVVTFLYRYQPVRRIRKTRLYERAAKWFDRAPFVTLTAASFLPIPIDVVRLLAISQGYPRGWFTLASAVGRWPRYFALAYFAEQFNVGWQLILAVLGITVVIGLWGGVPRLVRSLRNLKHKEHTP
jgi:membrane protein YqaA with SNARE-associated domain